MRLEDLFSARGEKACLRDIVSIEQIYFQEGVKKPNLVSVYIVSKEKCILCHS
jgi:hypothetical protein